MTASSVVVPGPAGEGEALAPRIIRGFHWNLAGSLVIQLVRTVVAISLARLLSPGEFGLAAMVLVLGPLVVLVSDLGLGMGLIRQRSISAVDCSTVFWATAALGLVWTALGIATSGWAADFYGHSSLKPMFSVYSVAFFLGGLGATHAALLRRSANFRGLQLRTLGATVVGSVAALVGAATGLGAWAIILQQVVMSACDAALLWRFSSWRPSLSFSFTSLRNLVGFGTRVFGTRVMFFLNHNTDNVLVGRFLGSGSLGFYSVAYNVMFLPLSKVLLPIQFTLGPYLMRMQDDPARMARAWFRANRMVAAVVIPASVGLMLVAPDLVDALLGTRWHPSVRIIQILTIVPLLQSLTVSAPDVLAASGRVGWLFRFSILSTLLQVGGFVVGLHWGLVGVAAAYAIANVFLAPFLVWLAAKSIESSPMRLFATLSSVAASTACMAALVLAVRVGLEDITTPVWGRLPAEIAIGLIAYVSLSAWCQRDVVIEAKRLLLGTRA